MTQDLSQSQEIRTCDLWKPGFDQKAIHTALAAHIALSAK